MLNLFYNCQSLNSLILSSNFDTSRITNMDNFFYNCLSLKSLDLSSFDTSLVTDMEQMFYNCKSLYSLILSSNFDTSRITNMEKFFYNCQSLKSLDLSSFDTSLVTDMQQMFYNCYKLVSLISNFDTINVNNMKQMFTNCQSLTTLDIHSFNTQNVLNMQEMFKNCKESTTIDLSNFDISKVTSMENMFEGDTNLQYINYKFFEERNDLNINKMFLSTPDDLVYCILDNENVPLELSQKICSINDCQANWLENKLNSFNKKIKDKSVLKDKCVFKKIKQLSEKFYVSKETYNTSVYSYKLGSPIEELKNQNPNITIIDFSSENINYLMNHFGLDKEKDNIYILIADYKSLDERSATSDYEYVLVLENGTELKLNNIKEDFYVEISVPIRDLDLANFDYAQIFDNQGYDIYNFSSEFYNDFCTPAYSGDNDIILVDRKKDIYPNNVTLCKNNCFYKSVDIESQRIICDCNLNINNNYTDDEDKNPIEEENNGNFFTYFIDKINYKIFKCYELFLDFNNLNTSISFYTILAIFIIIIILSIIFLDCGLQNIRISMYEDLPTPEKVKELFEQELKNRKKRKDSIKFNPSKKKNNTFFKEYTTKKIRKNIKSSKTCININSKKHNSTKITRKKMKNKTSKKDIVDKNKKLEIIIPKNKKNNSKKGVNIFTGNYTTTRSKLTKKDLKIYPINSKSTKINRNNSKKTLNINNKYLKEEIKKEKVEEYNDLPFTKAIRVDKRNIFQLFKSILFDKLELINIFINGEKIRIICICEYILSLLFDFFFNALLYSDDVVSHKYHNNGKLDFIVSFVISITSNIISSIVSNIIEYSKGIEERLDQISEIRREFRYLYAVNKFLKYLKIKMVLFIITELIVIGVCFYYIIIFCIIYSKSQMSL